MATLESYLQMTIAEIIKLAPEDFLDFYRQASSYIEISRIVNTKLKDTLKVKFLPLALDNLRQFKKDTGSTELTFGDYIVSVSVPKKVIWDTEVMENIKFDFPMDMWNNIVKTTYSVDERDYQKCNKHEKTLLNSARTEYQGSPTIKIGE